MKWVKGYLSVGVCFTLIVFLPACVKPLKRSTLMRVELGMTKQQLIKVLGEPKVFRGSIVNKFDQIIEVFEYEVDTGRSSSQILSDGLLNFGARWHIKLFWFYFYNDRLVQWNQAGDWQQASHAIHEIRFR